MRKRAGEREANAKIEVCCMKNSHSLKYMKDSEYRLAVMIIFAMPWPIRPQPNPTDPYSTP